MEGSILLRKKKKTTKFNSQQSTRSSRLLLFLLLNVPLTECAKPKTKTDWTEINRTSKLWKTCLPRLNHKRSKFVQLTKDFFFNKLLVFWKEWSISKASWVRFSSSITSRNTNSAAHMLFLFPSLEMAEKQVLQWKKKRREGVWKKKHTEPSAHLLLCANLWGWQDKMLV